MSKQDLPIQSPGQIVIQSDGKRRAIWSGLFALAWNVIVIFTFFGMWSDLPKLFQEPAFYLILLFPMAGILLFYFSIKNIMDWFRYGEVPLTLSTYPAYIGASVSGYIDMTSPVVGGVNAELSLRCAHHYTIDTDSEDSSTRIDYVWQHDLIVSGQSYEGKTQFPFTFQIEEDLPQSQGKGNERYEWDILAKLPTGAKELVRVYVISVDKRYA